MGDVLYVLPFGEGRVHDDAIVDGCWGFGEEVGDFDGMGFCFECCAALGFHFDAFYLAGSELSAGFDKCAITR